MVGCPLRVPTNRLPAGLLPFPEHVQTRRQLQLAETLERKNRITKNCVFIRLMILYYG